MIKTFKIADITLKNRYVLAPLAGYTDFSQRYLASLYGSSLNYTEMISAEALFYNSKATLKDINDTYLDKEFNNDSKLALQLFGGDEEHILKAIKICEDNASYDFLDFNVGCPVNKVIKQKAGSYWLKRLDELYPLLKNMVKVSSKPVIVKIRIGFSEILDIDSLIKNLNDTGISAICIHGRTRNEFFSGNVHFDIIKRAKEVSNIPIICNGSIDANNFLDILNYTNADAVMIGQNAIGHPDIFNDMIFIEEGKKIESKSITNQLDMLIKHIRLMYKYKDSRLATNQLRSISLKYLKGYPDANILKSKLIRCQNEDEYLTSINEFKSSLNS